MENTLDVVRRPDVSPETYLKLYGKPNKPFVIADGAEEWKARSTWNMRFFEERYGDVRLQVTRIARGRTESAGVKTIAEYADYLRTQNHEKEPLYLRDWVLEEKYPELLSHISVPSYLCNWLDRIPISGSRRHFWRGWKGWIFIGPKGTGTELHTDVVKSSAWLALISGQKEWVLTPPNEHDPATFAKVDLLNPDYEAYPFLRNSKRICYTQRPGELLVVPSGWWHQVCNSDATISVSGNFINESNIHFFCKDLLENGSLAELRDYSCYIPEIVPFLAS